MENKGEFKSGLFGFNKRQVLDYIYELSAEYKSQTDELEEKLSAAAEEKEALANQLLSKDSEVESAKLEALNAKDAYKELAEEYRAFRGRTEIMERRLKYYSDRQNDIEKELAKARAEAERINLEARKKADEIIKNSREYAKAQSENMDLVKKNAEDIRSEIMADLRRLEMSLQKLDDIGESLSVEYPVYSPKKNEKTAKSLLEEIKSIFKGVGY